MVIVNEDAFTANNLRKAGYEADPLDDGTLDSYQMLRVPMTSMTTRATEAIEEPQTGRGAAHQERLCPWACLLDVRATGRANPLLAGDEIRQAATDPGSEPSRLQSRIQLWRDGGAGGDPD